jgi:hypothetical protein
VLLATHVQKAIETASLIPFWTLSRGEQVITCELVPSTAGQSILRCGCGPQTVRSQFISSPAAATAVSEVWRAALLLQGFRVEACALSLGQPRQLGEAAGAVTKPIGRHTHLIE